VIVHVSMAIYKPEAGGRAKDANIQLGREMAEALEQEIPSLRHIEVGICQPPGDGGFDTVSYSEFDDMAAARATVAHPAHERLTAFLTEVTEVRNSATYEVNR
jgi:stress responsive alpha/beta barrel protein